MTERKYVIGGLLVLLVSCASIPVEYERFVIVPSKDALFAHDPKDDLILSKTCEPDSKVKGKCIALKEDVFYAMEKELLWLRDQVKQLQSSACK